MHYSYPCIRILLALIMVSEAGVYYGTDSCTHMTLAEEGSVLFEPMVCAKTG